MFHIKQLVTSTILIALCCAVDASPDSDLSAAIGDSNHDHQSPWIYERLMTLKVSAKCLAKLPNKETRALHDIAGFTRTISRYAKEVTGDDWVSIEGQSANDAATNRALVDKMITAFEPKFHITISVDGEDCSPNGLWLKYASSALTGVFRYPPKSGRATIVVEASETAKTTTIDVDKTGSTFTIRGPRDVEGVGYGDQIERAFKRVSNKD